MGATKPFPIFQPILARLIPNTKYIRSNATTTMPPSQGIWASVPSRAGSPSLAAFEPDNSKNAALTNNAAEKPATTMLRKAPNNRPFSPEAGSFGSGSGSGASSGLKVVRTMMYKIIIEANMNPGIKAAVNRALIEVSVIKP